jgi:hypothetical protein
VAALSELRREERDVFALRQRSHWQRIFNLFDEDGQGSIDRGEMRDLLVKFACDAKPEQLDVMILQRLHRLHKSTCLSPDLLFIQHHLPRNVFRQ